MTPFRFSSVRLAATVLLLASTAAACSDDEPTGPTTMAINGQGALAADASAGVVPCTIPSGGQVSAFPALLRSTGEFTDLGTTLGEIRADTCTVDPVGGILTVSGDVLQTGADGSTLDATFSAVVQPTGIYDLEVTIVGGGGKYVGAGGWMDGGGIIDPSTGAGDFAMSGELVL